MNAQKALSWARIAILAIPLFGLFSAVQLGCEASSANDLSKNDAGPGGNADQPYSGNYGKYDGYEAPYGGYDGYGGDGYDGYF